LVLPKIHQERGEVDDALTRLCEESLEANAFGEIHPEIALIVNHRLGNFHYVNDNYNASNDIYSQGLVIERRVVHDAHSNGNFSSCKLGQILIVSAKNGTLQSRHSNSFLIFNESEQGKESKMQQ